MSARIFNIGHPVRIITARPLPAFLRVRDRRPGLHLRPVSYRGTQGLVVATQHRSVALESPPIGYDVACYAPAELSLHAWPRPARLVVHALRAAELEPDPSPAESWEQFWARQGAGPFVLMRPWRHLSSTVAALFGGHPEIEVLVDRRYGERRQRSCRVREERRWEGERRGSLSVDTERG